MWNKFTVPELELQLTCHPSEQHAPEKVLKDPVLKCRTVGFIFKRVKRSFLEEQVKSQPTSQSTPSSAIAHLGKDEPARREDLNRHAQLSSLSPQIILPHPLRTGKVLFFPFKLSIWYILVLIASEEMAIFLLILLLIQVSGSHFSMMHWTVLEEHPWEISSA